MNINDIHANSIRRRTVSEVRASKQKYLDQIDRLYNRGASDLEMANTTGLSLHTISGYRRELGYLRPQSKDKKAVIVDMDAMRELAICKPWRLEA